MRSTAHISVWVGVWATDFWGADSAVSRAIGSTPSSSSDSDSLELLESCAGWALDVAAVFAGDGAGREGSALVLAFLSPFLSSSSLLSASLESLPLLLVLSLVLLALVALALAGAAGLGAGLDVDLVAFFDVESGSDSDSESDPESELELLLEGDCGFLLVAAAAAAAAAGLGVALDFFTSAAAAFFFKALFRKALSFSSLSLPLSLEASSEELLSESSDRSLLLMMAGIWGFDVDFLALASLTDLAIALRELTGCLGAMVSYGDAQASDDSEGEKLPACRTAIVSGNMNMGRVPRLEAKKKN